MNPIKIKFGTDGWRAIIAKEYTTDNVARVAYATALWLKERYEEPKAVLGHDCRFGGPMFAEVTAKVLCENGVKVFMAEGYVSTPMVSLGALKYNAGVGVVLTASHNPPTYNGYKLKAHFGGPMVPANITEVENLIPDEMAIPSTSLEEYKAKGLIEVIDLEGMYVDHIEAAFDMDAIRKSGINVGYDAMYGAGQSAMKRLLPDATFLHCDDNPGFKGRAPEPIHKNLLEFSDLIKNSGNIHIGIANDGDADRIGVYDSKGTFVDSHHVILLAIHYLHKIKGLGGKVVIAFSVTDRVKRLCEAYGLEVEVTKIGFKYIGGIMVDDDVLLGGEESGGIAVKGHIPERDGIWMGLLLIELMAKTGKTVEELIAEMYALVGAFTFHRDDLHIPNDTKWAIMQNCADGKYDRFGDRTVERVENIDGFKFHLDGGDWVMIRPSGTEPVLRVYAEAGSPEAVRTLLDTVHKVLKG
ncbi:MAG: hypothetical protein AB8B69_17315 [Chitinophagales bacterium]